MLLSVTAISQTKAAIYKNSAGYVKQTGYFTNSLLDSIWVMYNHKQDTVAIGHYHLGVKVGVWMWKQDDKTCKLYYSQGKKTKYEEYSNGVLIKQQIISQ